jgi:hypothetical protein
MGTDKLYMIPNLNDSEHFMIKLVMVKSTIHDILECESFFQHVVYVNLDLLK